MGNINSQSSSFGATPADFSNDPSFENWKQQLLDISKLGDSKSVASLLKLVHPKEARSQLLDCKDPDGKTALYLAVENNYISTVKLLLHSGSRAHSADHRGNSPIHIATKNGYVEILKLLLNKNARDCVVATDGNGFNALHCAISSKNLECFRLILAKCGTDEINHKNQNNMSCVLMAINEDLVEFLQALFAHPGQVELDITTKETHLTALHICCKKGNKELTEILIEKGANVNVTNHHGITPLHIALLERHIECAKVLLKSNQIVVDARDSSGITPLMLAATAGWLEGIQLILSKSSDPEKLLVSKDKQQRTVMDMTSVVTSDSNNNNQTNPEILEYLKQQLSHLNNKNTAISLQLCSDLHVEFYREYASIPTMIQPSAPYLCLLGDIGLANDEKYHQFLLDISTKFKMVFVLAGNHEYYHNIVDKAKEKIAAICAERDNLVFMYRKSLLVEGIRILGTTLWSHIPDKFAEEVGMCLSDFRVIKMSEQKGDNLRVEEYNRWHQEEVDWLKTELTKAVENSERVVVLTHHSPLFNCGSSDPQYFCSPSNSAFCTDLSEFMGKPIELWAYGHTHWFQDMTIKGTRVISNPHGYPRDIEGNSGKAYDPQLVIDI